MDRKYKVSEKIAVLNTNGRILKHIKRVPYSIHGFDSYMYKGVLMPGYWNGTIGTYIKSEG